MIKAYLYNYVFQLLHLIRGIHIVKLADFSKLNLLLLKKNNTLKLKTGYTSTISYV